MGGGGAGAISHSAYMENVHKDMLYHNAPGGGGDTTNRSVISVMNTALTAGSSPFLGATTYNPDTDLAASATAVASMKTLVDAMIFSTDYITGYNVATAITVDTTTLDIAALDTATLDVAILSTDTIDTDTLDVAILDTFSIDDSAVAADVAAFSAEQEDQLDNIILPRFKAGMLNINAVASSSFVLGEAQLRAFKARDVAKHSSELRVKLNLQAGEIRGKFMSERREIDARFKLQFREITAKFKMQHKDKQAEYQTQYNDHTRQFKMQYQELTQRYKLQFQELTSKYKMQFSEITARHKQQRQMHIQAASVHMLSELMKKNDLTGEVTRYTLESNRMKIVAKGEQAQENLSILEHDRKWDLDVFQYGTAVLGGIGGGAFIPGKKSKVISALAGALSGAALGTQAGGFPYGTAAGAVIGTAAGYYSAS